ncbi:MAG: hypothetical protein ACLUE6_06385 [Acutalibacteraceae bacterium]
MKKKVFIQLNIWWNLLLIALLSMPIALFIVMIVEMVQAGEIKVMEIIGGCLFLLAAIIFIALLDKHHITFDDTKCFSPSDWQRKNERIQFKTVIFYEEIADIKLILSKNNSLDHRIDSIMPSTSVLKPYFEITCKDGSRKRILAMYFSKRQRIKIINEFKKRMASVGNDVVLPSAEELVAKQGKIGFEI